MTEAPSNASLMEWMSSANDVEEVLEVLVDLIRLPARDVDPAASSPSMISAEYWNLQPAQGGEKAKK